VEVGPSEVKAPKGAPTSATPPFGEGWLGRSKESQCPILSPLPCLPTPFGGVRGRGLTPLPPEGTDLGESVLEGREEEDAIYICLFVCSPSPRQKKERKKELVNWWVDGIGEGSPRPKMGGAGTLIKEVKNMVIREKTLAEVLSLGLYKASKTQKRRVKVYIPARFLPPTPPYKMVSVDSEYGRVKVYTQPHERGGWVIFLTFPPDAVVFNPVLRGEAARELMEKLEKLQK